MSITQLNVQPYDWKWEDDVLTDRLTVRIWGLTDKSESVLLRIPYEAKLYIELPYCIRNNVKQWNLEDVNELMRQIDNVPNNPDLVKRYTLQNKIKFYYHQRHSTQYILCQFTKQEDMYVIQRRIKYKTFQYLGMDITLTPRESEVDPCLNLRRKLGVRPTQWLTVNGNEVNGVNKISSSKYEMFVDYITPGNVIPRTDAEISYITKPLVYSFDIECYSANHNKMPEKFISTDVIYIITCCIQRYKDPSSQINVCFATGKCNVDRIHDKHPGAIIRMYSDELSLLQGFMDSINEFDPEVIIGYNIFSFDFPYCDARLKLNPGVEWSNCSKLKAGKTFIVNKAWESSAYGRIETNFLEAEGRICIDLYPHFKRNAKLDNYRLDTVAKHFIGETKFDMPAKRMFQIYKQFIENPDDNEAINQYTDVISYGIQDAKLPIKLFDQQIIWLDNGQMAYAANVTPFEVVSRGIGIRTYNLVMEELHKRNIILDDRIRKYLPFDGGFVGKPIPGIYDNVICLDFKSLYPSIIIGYNLCPTTYIPPEREYLYKPHQYRVFEWKSVIDESKLKKTMSILDEILEQGGDEDDIEEEEEDEEEKEVLKTYSHRYVFYCGHNNPQTDEEKKIAQDAIGVLPKILKELVAERGKVTKMAAATDDKVLASILNTKGNALKINANGAYGVLGADEGKLYSKEVAIVTTFIGRTSIQGVNDTVTQEYGAQVVYNDTDSSMFTLPGVSGPKLTEMGDEIAERVTKKFAPLVIEHEKRGKMLSICPKKYVFWLLDDNGEKSYLMDRATKKPRLDDNGNKIPNILYKGVVANRRDNSPWLRETYKKLLDNIMNEGTFNTSLDIVFDAINDILTRNVPLDKLVVTKQLRFEYKNETATMALFASELSRRGIPASAGERLPFIVVQDSEGREKIGYKMRLLDTYKQDIATGVPVEPIDREYYIEKGFMKPIQQLLSVAYGNDIKHCEEKNTKTNIRLFYNACYRFGNGKYYDILNQVISHLSTDELRIEYLTKHAPGKTNFKSLSTQYYTKHGQPDLRISDDMIKHYLKFQKTRRSLMNELMYKSHYYKAYYGDINLLYPSYIKQITTYNIQQMCAYYGVNYVP